MTKLEMLLDDFFESVKKEHSLTDEQLFLFKLTMPLEEAKKFNGRFLPRVPK
jgi:hypothetical protein